MGYECNGDIYILTFIDQNICGFHFFVRLSIYPNYI